jgi:geranylgeranyl diphosphate synthase, type I
MSKNEPARPARAPAGDPGREPAPGEQTPSKGSSAAIESDLRRVARRVEDRLERFFDGLETAPVDPVFGPLPRTSLLPQVRDLTLRGGKRLRAALVIHGAALFAPEAGGDPRVLDAAAAVELLQTYFLIHDDIMDRDTTRRGGPAVHVALGREVGDAGRGEGLGILAGDLAAALFQTLMSSFPLEAETRVRLQRVICAMQIDVIHGQALDVMNDVPARQVARHKTASYTTVGPLAVGAVLGGADARSVERLAEIARPLGVAFQYRDDLLGAFGEPSRTGKPVGTDFKEGKRTILVEEGLARLDERGRRRFEAMLGRAEATPDEIAEACRLLEECGARRACERRIARLAEEFIDGLAGGEYSTEGTEFLDRLARFMAEREA